MRQDLRPSPEKHRYQWLQGSYAGTKPQAQDENQRQRPRHQIEHNQSEAETARRDLVNPDPDTQNKPASRYHRPVTTRLHEEQMLDRGDEGVKARDTREIQEKDSGQSWRPEVDILASQRWLAATRADTDRDISKLRNREANHHLFRSRG